MFFFQTNGFPNSGLSSQSQNLSRYSTPKRLTKGLLYPHAIYQIAASLKFSLMANTKLPSSLMPHNISFNLFYILPFILELEAVLSYFSSQSWEAGWGESQTVNLHEFSD